MSGYQKKETFKGYWRKEIVIYKGDELIDQGTIQEVAERRKIRKDTLYWGLMPTAGRRKDKCKNQDRVTRVVAVE